MSLAETVKAEVSTVQCKFAQARDQPCSFGFPRGHPRSPLAQFDVYSITKSMWCGACGGCHASTAWRCPCDKPWHRCCLHFSSPTTSVQQRSAPPVRGHRRPAAVANAESARKLLQLEPKRALASLSGSQARGPISAFGHTRGRVKYKHKPRGRPREPSRASDPEPSVP